MLRRSDIPGRVTYGGADTHLGLNMYAYRWNLAAMSLALVTTACADDGKSGDGAAPEGANPGECSDGYELTVGADTDGDGVVDSTYTYTYDCD